MKANRLLSELMLLQARGRISTRELAERMEISQRTAHRDMEALCMAGVPLVAWRGSQGGWEIDPGWRTQVPGFDEKELSAFLLAQPNALGGSGLGAAAERALNKIFAALPKEMQSQAASLRSRIHMDTAGWGPWVEDSSALPIVQEAVAQDRRLTFYYKTSDRREGMRTVDALGVVCKQNTWYLVGRGETGLRTYRISRMSMPLALDQGFERPKDFDLKAYWLASTAEFSSRRRSVRAVMALAPGTAEDISRWRSLEAVDAPGVALPDGWTCFAIEFEAMGHAVFCSLGLGSKAIVLEPEELMQKVRDEIQLLAAQRPEG
jgi:predicted DNA-binding transcriptional regulator YafY